MGQLFFMLGSLLCSGIGIVVYLSGLDHHDWMTRAIATAIVTVALALADIGQRRYYDLLLARLAAVNALLFLGMLLYSLYLNAQA